MFHCYGIFPWFNLLGSPLEPASTASAILQGFRGDYRITRPDVILSDSHIQGVQVAVISLLGRMHMSIPTDNIFHAVDRVLKKIPSDVKIVVVDIHAEVTSEKIAIGWYLDGKVSVVFGTHTHVATADQRVLPKGTAYITDLGMTGPHESVLGRNVEPVIKSLAMQIPCAYSIASGDLRLNGIISTIDSNTGLASDIQRICVNATLDNLGTYDQLDGKPDNLNNHLL